MRLKDNTVLMFFLSVMLDALGFVSFLIPGVGEFSDIVWAPASAYLMTKLYKGKAGKIGAAISFIEEALPGLDVIPTFTIMWVYTYVISKNTKEVQAVKKS